VAEEEKEDESISWKMRVITIYDDVRGDSNIC